MSDQHGQLLLGLNSIRSNYSGGSSAGDIQHVAHLSEHVGSLYLNEDYSDITLIVDGQRYVAHKVILACRSDYFR